MSNQEVFVQQFARLFNHYSEALSSDRKPESPTRGSVLADEQHRLVAAASLAISELERVSRPENDSHRYFATPGEAEWGC